jgi:hypothetical protein
MLKKDSAPNRLPVASLYGMVAASFTIEQYGPPKLTQVERIGEVCNGEESLERLRDLTRWTEEE